MSGEGLNCLSEGSRCQKWTEVIGVIVGGAEVVGVEITSRQINASCLLHVYCMIFQSLTLSGTR